MMEKLKEASIIISTGVTELSRGEVDEVIIDCKDENTFACLLYLWSGWLMLEVRRLAVLEVDHIGVKSELYLGL